MVCSRCGKEFIIIYNESKKKPFKTCEVCREKGRLAKKRWAASKKIYGTSKVDKIAKECENLKGKIKTIDVAANYPDLIVGCFAQKLAFKFYDSNGSGEIRSYFLKFHKICWLKK